MQRLEWAPFPLDLHQERATGILSRRSSPPDQCRSRLFTYVRMMKGIGDNDLRISANVCTQIGRNGSSTASATAMNARITVSESGTEPDAAAPCGSRRSEPIATIFRMSLMTCSFSTACLLSRANDL
jgi:hypothetical protein